VGQDVLEPGARHRGGGGGGRLGLLQRVAVRCELRVGARWGGVSVVPRVFTGANPAAAATAPVDLLKYAIKVREVSIELEAG
jgi:hypothetical protein